MAKRSPDQRAFITHGDIKVPIAIYYERRGNVRVSIGVDAVHLRLPSGLTKSELKDKLRWAEKWLLKRFEGRPSLANRFEYVQVRHHDRLKVMNDVFVIHVEESNLPRSSAELKNKDLYLIITADLSDKERSKTITYLINKVLCQKYEAQITEEVRLLNKKHFNAHIGSVQVKNVKSSWGMCSHDGHISLSINLLFCPKEIRTYVIIHELAHLLEHNHSDRFWALVEGACPSYMLFEEWLKTKGAGINFMEGITSSSFYNSVDSKMDLIELADQQPMHEEEFKNQSNSPVDKEKPHSYPEHASDEELNSSNNSDTKLEEGQQLSLFD